jgi:uncharacterized protein involved in exopolysaccharide biosynthesis
MADLEATTSRAIYRGDDEISLMEIANGLLRNWRILTIFPFLFAVAAAIWSLSQDRKYQATATFLPEATQSSAAGGAAALAQQFGVDVGAGRNSLSPQFYMDLVRSRAILQQAVTAKYKVGGRESTLVELLDTDGETNRVEAAIDELRGMIGVSVARATGVVQVSVSTKNPGLSEQITGRLVELLHTFNVQIRQANAREEARFVSGRLAEALAEMNMAEDKLEEFLRRNREFRNSPELNSRHERLQREVAMRQQLYMSLQNSEEQARIDAFRDTPLITVIDHPAGSAKPQSRGTVTRVILAALLGVLFAIVVILLKEFMRRGREARNPEFEEFQGLARAAWADLSRPARRSKGK